MIPISYCPGQRARARICLGLLALFLGACTSTAAPAAISTPPNPPASIPTAATSPAAIAASTVLPNVRDRSAWQLVFHDEFNSGPINLNQWRTDYWWGRTNKPELQYYAPDAFEFQNGLIRIKADKRSMGGREYTSGLISTYQHFTFTYGYAEIRAQVPAGKGLWPAFWLTGDEKDVKNAGEIDVMEILGDQPQTIYTTLHYHNGPGKSLSDQGNFKGPDFSKGFHTFAVDWSPTAVVWYVDEVEQFRVTHDVPDMPLYVIANLAVGGEWPGYPDDTTQFPAFFDIDYIRIYKH
ncbi:MAG TPA: glycoside hydrolase family 16 protein [Anaerolineae bacterium]